MIPKHLKTNNIYVSYLSKTGFAKMKTTPIFSLYESIQKDMIGKNVRMYYCDKTFMVHFNVDYDCRWSHVKVEMSDDGNFKIYLLVTNQDGVHVPPFFCQAEIGYPHGMPLLFTFDGARHEIKRLVALQNGEIL